MPTGQLPHNDQRPQTERNATQINRPPTFTEMRSYFVNMYQEFKDNFIYLYAKYIIILLYYINFIILCFEIIFY